MGQYSTSYSTETHPQEGGRSDSHVCFGNPTVYGTQDKYEQVAVFADLADVSLLSGQLGILGVCPEKHPLKWRVSNMRHDLLALQGSVGLLRIVQSTLGHLWFLT